ncbi:MAG: class I SAM-dependent methyltransferase [Candidatus Aenigmarchaeota archaeon]|nr:class I SAM-dependent methyltransferase [Candidatus Aenigmarchaeota archaeon]
MPAYSRVDEAMLRMMPSNKLILDAGCGAGTIGKYLKERGNTVYGVDYDPEAVQLARKNLDKAALYDLEKGGTLPFREKFDIILLGGVVEHLKDPVTAVRRLKTCLKKDGMFIITVPNVACWTMRLRLMAGDFTYAETGILDRTHLHFYTLKTFRRFLKDCGLESVKMDINPSIFRAFYPLLVMPFYRKNAKDSHDVHAAVLDSKYYRVYRSYLLPAECLFSKLWKTMFAYEFVAMAKMRHDL